MWSSLAAQSWRMRQNVSNMCCFSPLFDHWWRCKSAEEMAGCCLIQQSDDVVMLGDIISDTPDMEMVRTCVNTLLAVLSRK